MKEKENKGGFVTNRQIDEDNKVKEEEAAADKGEQPNADPTARQKGDDVQQQDAFPQKDEEKG